jgi:hypothetical protein
LCSFVT